MANSKKKKEQLNIPQAETPNAIIRAPYGASLMAQQMAYLGIFHMQNRQEGIDRSDKGNLRISIPVGVIKETYLLSAAEKDKAQIIERNKKSIYRDLVKCEEELSNIKLVVKTKTKVGVANFIDSAFYHSDTGELEIIYGKTFEEYLLSMKTDGYSQIRLPSVFNLKDEYGERLYTNLLSWCYDLKPGRRDMHASKTPYGWRITYDVYELRFLLGVLDSSANSSVIAELKKPNPDWQKAAEMIPKGTKEKPGKKLKRSYLKTWAEFKRSVLDKAVKDVNENSDLSILNVGEDGKLLKDAFAWQKHAISAVTFVVNYKSKADRERYNVDSRVDDKKYNYFVPEDSPESLATLEIATILTPEVKAKVIKSEDILTIAMLANYDVNEVRREYEYTKSKGASVKNFLPYLLNAIKNKYADNGETVEEVIEKPAKKRPNAEEFLRLLDQINEWFPNHTMDEDKQIAEAAEYHIGIIKDVIDDYNSKKAGTIKNPVGWIISRCRDMAAMPQDYQDDIEELDSVVYIEHDRDYDEDIDTSRVIKLKGPNKK